MLGQVKRVPAMRVGLVQIQWYLYTEGIIGTSLAVLYREANSEVD